MASFRTMFTNIRSIYSLGELSEILGYSRSYIHDVEKGRRMPSVEMIERISNSRLRHPYNRKAWHLVGAREHGWDV